MARKRFGQNFLHEQGVIDKIIHAITPEPSDHLVEIGPGHAALSQPLLAAAHKLQAIEIDRDLVANLRQRNYPGLEIIEADALKFDYSRLISGPSDRLRLVGNLPYNISSPLLFALLNSTAPITDMHFMLQKEVVDRMVAPPGSKTYGRLSVAIAARAQATPLFDVGPGAFKPAPKVTSSVVRLIPRQPEFHIQNWQNFDQVLAAAFSKRRKTIRNGLKNILSAEQIEQAGVPSTVRPEQISPAQFAKLANLVG